VFAIEISFVFVQDNNDPLLRKVNIKGKLLAVIMRKVIFVKQISVWILQLHHYNYRLTQPMILFSAKIAPISAYLIT